MNAKTDNLLTAAYFFALLVWSILVYALLAQLHVSKWPLAIDFMQIYKLGAMIIHDPHRISDSAAHTEWLNRIAYPAVTSKAAPSHGPLSLYVFAMPFVLLPPKQSLVVWCLLSIAVGVTAILRLRKADGAASRARFCILAFASFPSVHTFWLGQLTWFYFGIMAMFFVAIKEKRRLLACIALALATLKLQYWFLILPALLRPGWRLALLQLTLAGALFVAAIGSWIGWTTLLNWPAFLLQFDPQADSMVSARGITTLLFGYKFGSLVSTVATVAGIIVSGIIWLGCGERDEALPWVASISVLIALVSSMHVNAYDCLLLMLAACITMPGLTFLEVLSQKYRPYRLWCAILLFYPAISWLCYIMSSMVLKEFRIYSYCCLAIDLTLLVLAAVILHELMRNRELLGACRTTEPASSTPIQ